MLPSFQQHARKPHEDWRFLRSHLFQLFQLFRMNSTNFAPKQTPKTPRPQLLRVMLAWEMGEKNFVVLHHWGRIYQFLCQGCLNIGPSERLQERCGFPEGQEQEFGTIRASSG